MLILACINVFILLLLYEESTTGCPSNCVNCQDSVSCKDCASSHYLDNHGYCSQCPQNCEKCLDYANCTQCSPGFYGRKCNKNCSGCVDEKCDLHGCRHGCKAGYYEINHSVERDCKQCSSNCIRCEDNSKCNVCNDTYYLEIYENKNLYCQPCTSRHSACAKSCEIKNCKFCEVWETLNQCRVCEIGYKYKQNKCVPNSDDCSDGCATNNCNSLGICLSNCKDGRTGKKCADFCETKCSSCNKNNRSVCTKCVNDFFTSACNISCPSSCRKVAGANTCRIDDGYCENGCEKNTWGYLCNMSCPVNCASGAGNVCFRNNGSCCSGCKQGFDGVTCNISSVVLVKSNSKGLDKAILKALDQSTETLFLRTTGYNKENLAAPSQDGNMSIVLIGTVAGGGAALVIVTSVFIAWLVQMRRNPNCAGNKERREEVDNDHTGANTNLQLITPGNEDCLYAQVNKVTKRNNDRKEEPQMATCGIVFAFEVDEVVINDTDLEEIEDVNISSIESDVNIPTSDTYYNTASLLRSRIEVSNLCEYTKNKSDYKKEFERLPVGLTRACTEGHKPQNRVKNRYNGIYAYDATRVVLKSGNYVNANFIDGHKKYPAYIASLGPTKSAMNNFATFWEMIWQEKTYKIVMLTNLDEAKKMKCEQYWPAQGNENNYGDYKVRCTAEKVFSEFTVREFTVARGKETREVTQYQYTAWPDKTVPDSVASLLEFRDKVEQKQLTTAGPMMVHCSAGIGRTGTYIALDILIKEGKDDHSVDIFGCVNALRGQRVQLVQNLEQYVYLHHCILYALSCAPEPLPVSTMAHFTSDERLSIQHKAFVSLQHLTNRDKKMGTKNMTRKENRTGADIPDDKHRVRLGLIEKDYINAVYVNGYQEYNKFILAQTPLQGTLEDFASMLYQEQCSCVVCLDDENVIDKSIVQYLPLVNKVATFGQFQVICTDVDRKQDFTCRKLKVSRIGVSLSDEVSVSHYQFKGWSSIDCVPRSIQSFLNLVTDVEKTYQSLNRQHPIVVHCSTGAERSGLFCAVSILLEKVALEKEVSVLNTVCQVCSRRRSAFQDIEHLRFCYSCVEQMSEVPDSSTYYNSRNM